MCKVLHIQEEAAELLGLPKTNSIEWLIRSRKIPHRKVNGLIKFTHQDLLDYIESAKVEIA